MAKKPGYVRTTISVPAELKRRMDKISEDVNWSALACGAFETKLAEVATKKENKSMEDVITRLRESKRTGDNQLTKEGREVGEQWVKEFAQVPEIRRLKKYVDSHQPNEQYLLFEVPSGNAYSAAQHLVFAVQPENDGDRQAARDFWEVLVGEDRSSDTDEPEFLEGFVFGALDLWDSIKDQV